MPESGNNSSKTARVRLAVLIVLAAAAVPALIALGVAVWDDRRYYIVSLLIILVSMIPFALRFERRKPGARELVVLSAMIAIGVAARAAFYMVPQFKPMLAIIIITGVAFGPESGFIAGAMTVFVSNFIFGQGPWTPWQMEAAGLCGLLAGLLFFGRKDRVKLLPLTVFGGACALVLYGLIVDTSTVFTTQTRITWQALTAAYASGFVLNVVHAAATVVFLLLLARPMLKKLDRLRIKYGLLDRACE